MTEFNPATMNPAAIILPNNLDNSSDNIHFVLISKYDIKLYLGNILMKSGVININPEDFNLTLEETN